ncbi:MAG: hypothetical protein QOE84_489 [Actinomycetota bacterium]|jgi:hypothetical protein|nr:hypothetical protein [Actinomycetota bacterium]
MRTASPLGRYDQATTDDALHEVRLIGVPVRVMVAGREHHDELMREFALLALSRSDIATVPTRLIELTQILGVQYGGAAARPDEEVDAALARGDETIDLTYVVPAHVVDGANTLSALMAEADEFCRTEQLLTLARSSVLFDFAEWYIGEFRRQVAGEQPQPWTGPLDP